MYAVIKTGGKQYRVAADDIIEIEKISGAVGDTVQFAEVLMVAGEGSAEIGKPLVSGASVVGEVTEQGRGAKIIIFKKRRRHNYRRKKGHRQELTTVRITEILTGGKAPSRAAKPAIWDPAIGRVATVKAAGAAASGKGAAGAGRPFALLSGGPEGEPDDLSRIGGIGDKIAQTLNDHGIHHYWQIAAMSDADIAEVEKDLKFPGRIKREEWRDQARELMAGQAPRAKVDRDRAGGAAHKDTGARKFVRLKAPEGEADDLGKIGGVAEKTVHVLNGHGIFHFWQVAAMTDDDIHDLEKDLKFPGRIKREEWQEQARELMAGKAPRAVVDRDREDRR